MQNRITHCLALDELAEVAHQSSSSCSASCKHFIGMLLFNHIKDRRTQLSSDSVDWLMFLHGLANKQLSDTGVLLD